MSDILFVNACVRENSRTLSLAEHVLGSLGADFDEVKLYEVDLSPLDVEGIRERDEVFSSSILSVAHQD